MKRTILSIITAACLLGALVFGINAASATQATPPGTQPTSVSTAPPVVPNAEGHEVVTEPYPAGATLCLHTSAGDQTIVNGEGSGQSLREGDSITDGPC